MKPTFIRKTFAQVVARWAVTIGSAATLLVAAGSFAQAEMKTLEAGKLTIGINGDMPMTQFKDGQLSGTDGEVMVFVTKQIGLEPNVVQMDWSALIEATKQGKLDVMHGAMGWLEARTKIMIFERTHLLFWDPSCSEGREQFYVLCRHEGSKSWHRHRLHTCARA